MLSHLQINNLAVDTLELEFADGLTVLTGETGAGKSILVDALGLALGARADSTAIRSGADRCEVSAGFELDERPDLVQWLKAQDLDDEARCLLRRIVTREGRSRGYINGRQVPMQTLRELAPRLIDICGQQSHQSLRHATVQANILDHYGDLASLVDEMGATFAAWQTIRDQLDELTATIAESKERLDLLSFQAGELSALNLQPGEFAEVESEHRRISNSAQIAESASSVLDGLYEGDGPTAQALVTSARSSLRELAALDSNFESSEKLLGEAEILISEAVDDLRAQSSGIEHDPRRQLHLEQRLSSIIELARKHKVEPDELPDLALRLKQELDDVEHIDDKLDELNKKEIAARESVEKTAGKLTSSRQRNAKALSKAVTDNMQGLGMPQGEFKVTVSPQPNKRITARGVDLVTFEVSANPGQPPGPLSKVASGGELSRISLSVQVVALASDTVPTLIFDEVDAGVGGAVAEMVGKRLAELTAERQVLCVTHLPQVASQADHHFRVAKISDGIATRTTVKPLARKERVDEVARMLGGVEITKRTRAHAEEMLTVSESRKAG